MSDFFEVWPNQGIKTVKDDGRGINEALSELGSCDFYPLLPDGVVIREKGSDVGELVHVGMDSA